MKAERRVPDLEYLTECDNRVWGCSSRPSLVRAAISLRSVALDSAMSK